MISLSLRSCPRAVRCGSILVFATLSAASARAQEGSSTEPQASTQERLAELERQNAELERRIDVVAGELEGLSLAEVIRPLGDGRPGLGPAASKVYGIDQGVSIGGYGEFLYENRDADGSSDQADALRAVLYFGYRFDEKWLLNTEIEFEHGGDETGVEFAYLDYLATPAFNVRAGLLLVPMGFVNELHEPTTFLSAKRPGIETAILPSTWREIGAGVHGELGDFVYRGYLLNGFDATGFSAEGLRGGRQKGSKALAEDFALTARLDWMGVPGLTLGGSGWIGDSGQDQVDGGDVGTTIWEGHAEWRWRGFRARGLYTQAQLDDVAELNNTLTLTGTESVGEELNGWYAELGYDLFSWLRPGSGQELVPFVRYETFDTQAEVPSGSDFASDPANDVEILTAGLNWKPIPGIVVKLDWMDIDNDAGTGSNQVNVALGYVF
jgi:hypothetical protein